VFDSSKHRIAEPEMKQFISKSKVAPKGMKASEPVKSGGKNKWEIQSA